MSISVPAAIPLLCLSIAGMAQDATGEHFAGVNIDRKPVQAGAIRFARGAPETYSVEYLGDTATEYHRIELRTEPLDCPIRDIRLPPVTLDPRLDHWS